MPAIHARVLRRLTTRPSSFAIPAHLIAGRRFGGYRFISVQQTPSTDTNKIQLVGQTLSASSPDASFEVLGAPYSLLSVTLSPSQELHTRRGSLVGLAGSPDDTISTLRILSPVRHALLGIPFLYQRITSTTPINALISTPTPYTSFAVLQLDGTTDWKLAQRAALLAWTGKSLSISPAINTRLSLAHWGSTNVTGRGLVAFAGQGHVYSIDLVAGETYTAHPANVLAYSTSSPSPPPTPYRFKSSNIRFQIPLQLGNWFPSSTFVRNVQASDTWRFFANISLRVRTWARRTIWGDRLFLRFEGPTTILLQSRAARLRDVVTSEQVNEIADAPAGVVGDVVREVRLGKGGDRARTGIEGATPSASPLQGQGHDQGSGQGTKPQPRLTVASVSSDGKVTFQATQEGAETRK